MTDHIISGCAMIILTVILRTLFLKRLPKDCFRVMWILAALRMAIPFSFKVYIPVIKRTSDDIGNTLILKLADTADAVMGTQKMGGDNIALWVIGILWALGTLICGGFLVFTYLRMCRTARSGRDVVDDLLTQQSCLVIKTGDGAKAPFSCGVIDPVIYIPEYMMTLGKERLCYIVAHEDAHIKRGDQPVKLFLAAVLCINWYNPLVWLMWVLANRDIELACDEAVIRRGKKKEYALCLIESEEARSLMTVCSFRARAPFGAKALNERIECIMKSKKLTICSFIAAGLILTVMSAFFIQVTAKEMSGDDMDTSRAETNAETKTPYEELISEFEDQKTALESELSEIETDAIEEVESTELELICPLKEYGRITGKFGTQTNPISKKTQFHTGIDVAAEKDTPVYAAADGVVTHADYDYERGNYVMIDHGNGVVTSYDHLGKHTCKAGDKVDAGDKIGEVGRTGSSTGFHLHFEIIQNGEYVSPEALFN